MAIEQVDYNSQFAGESIKLRDMEEKQRILKDRISMISQNLIEIKEATNLRILEIKKDIEKISQETIKLISFVETVSNELPKFAKRDDLEILIKQAKMFQPLDFATKKDLEKLKKQKD